MDLSIIKKFEGLRLTAYRCSAGVPTIGYGSTFYPDGRKVKMGDTLRDEAHANKLLEAVIEKSFLPYMYKIPTWSKMNENQQLAVLSFAFNLGAHFYNSNNFNSITRLLSDVSLWKDRTEVQRVFKLYSKAGGKTLKGLLTRRIAEASLFLKPVVGNPVNKPPRVVTAIRAKVDTYLKKTTQQASDLPDTRKAIVLKGKEYYLNPEVSDLTPDETGHVLVNLDYSAGNWYIFTAHWEPIYNV